MKNRMHAIQANSHSGTGSFSYVRAMVTEQRFNIIPANVCRGGLCKHSPQCGFVLTHPKHLMIPSTSTIVKID